MRKVSIWFSLILIVLMVASSGFVGCAPKKATPTPAPTPKPAPAVTPAPTTAPATAIAPTKAPTPAPVQTPDRTAWPKSLRFLTGVPGGVWYLGAGTLSSIIEKEVGIRCTIEEGGGGRNISLMGQKEGDLANNWSQLTAEAVTGIMTYEGKPVKNLRLLYNQYPAPFWVQAKKGINSVKDLKGKPWVCRMASNPQNEAFTKVLLEANGMTMSDIKPIQVTSMEWSQMLIEGTALAATHQSPPSSASAQDPARTGNCYALPFSQAEIDALLKKFTGMTPYTIKAGILPGSDKDAPCVAQMSIVLVRQELPDDLVYEIAKATFKRIADLRAVAVDLSRMDADLAVSSFSAPFHAGAVKFYKEQGVWTDKQEKVQQALLAQIGATK